MCQSLLRRTIPREVMSVAAMLRPASYVYDFHTTHLYTYLRAGGMRHAQPVRYPITPLLCAGSNSMISLMWFEHYYRTVQPHYAKTVVRTAQYELEAPCAAGKVTAEQLMNYIATHAGLFHVRSMTVLGDRNCMFVTSTTGAFVYRGERGDRLASRYNAQLQSAAEGGSGVNNAGAAASSSASVGRGSSARRLVSLGSLRYLLLVDVLPLIGDLSLTAHDPAQGRAAVLSSPQTGSVAGWRSNSPGLAASSNRRRLVQLDRYRVVMFLVRTGSYSPTSSSSAATAAAAPGAGPPPPPGTAAGRPGRAAQKQVRCCDSTLPHRALFCVLPPDCVG